MSPERVAAARVKDALSNIQLPDKATEPTRGTLPDIVAAALREAILEGDLEPGAWLREAEVARELEVSRTPVRDALRILDAEGLVHISANHGAVVTQMDINDIIELYVVREELESLAARLAARLSPQSCFEELSACLDLMRKGVEAHDIEGLGRLNAVYHAAILRAAENRYLERMLTPIQNAVRRFPDPTLGLPGRKEEMLSEHIELAAAIGNGNEDEAARLAKAHIHQSAEMRIILRKALYRGSY